MYVGVSKKYEVASSSFTGRLDIFRDSVHCFFVVLLSHSKYFRRLGTIVQVHITTYTPICSLRALTPKRVNHWEGGDARRFYERPLCRTLIVEIYK